MSSDSLSSQLAYEPCELRFGTSGRRGLVRDLTHLEIYVNALGELRYLQRIPVESGGIRPGGEFYFARDLRPSSLQLAQAVQRAVVDAGMRPVNLGSLPTPALAFHALSRGRAAIMVTGSHIPFDRNGYKLYTSRGELLKSDEAPINESVKQVRETIYAQPISASLFDQSGAFRVAPELIAADDTARSGYIDRYRAFFRGLDMGGRTVVVFEHSAVGRDILCDLLRLLGADVIPVGRSETFVPVDTENIDEQQLASIGDLVRSAQQKDRPIHAILSTDGDSDRPLLLGWEEQAQRPVFFPGDLLGMVTARYLRADAVVVPITSNDGIELGPLAGALEPRTKVGSPFVIEGIERAKGKGRMRVCAWEANGGFLLGSDIERDGAWLSALATRDAMLPLLAVLAAAHERDVPVAALFGELPPRYGRSGLLRNFPRPASERIIRRLSPDAADSQADAHRIRQEVEEVFSESLGFGKVESINYLDGVRIRFSNGDVAHVRPSGNADELRIYATSNTPERAAEICSMGVAEPSGLLRTLEVRSV